MSPSADARNVDIFETAISLIVDTEHKATLVGSADREIADIPVVPGQAFDADLDSREADP